LFTFVVKNAIEQDGLSSIGTRGYARNGGSKQSDESVVVHYTRQDVENEQVASSEAGKTRQQSEGSATNVETSG
jgi:hypothetical protein